MTNRHASNASPRCALVTATNTIGSVGESSPTRWITLISYDVETPLRLDHDCLERLLGHARIVLERQGANGCIVIDVAHGADERRDRADAPVARAKLVDLGAGVERLALHAHRHHQPPVTGGNNATSSPSCTTSSSFATA